MSNRIIATAAGTTTYERIRETAHKLEPIAHGTFSDCIDGKENFIRRHGGHPENHLNKYGKSCANDSSQERVPLHLEEERCCYRSGVPRVLG